MGIIKAVTQAVGSALGDQWLEAIEPDDMATRRFLSAAFR